MLWEAGKYAWRGSVSRSGAWAPGVGAVVLWSILALMGYHVVIPSDLIGTVFVFLMCAGAAWVVIFFARLAYAPYHALRIACAENRSLREQLKERPAEPIPDWSIRELFFHIHPAPKSGPRTLASVEREVRDKLSTAQLRIWGSRTDGITRERRPLHEIDKDRWQRSEFEFWFLEDSPQNDNIQQVRFLMPAGTAPLEYTNLQVNRAQALGIWPSNVLILIEKAARLFYEAMERVGIDDMVQTNYSSPEVMLMHFKTVFFTEAKNGAITLLGKRLPSTQLLPIAVDHLSDLHPREGDKSSLSSLMRGRPVDFYDVQISCYDLDYLIKDRIALLKRMERSRL